MPAKDRREILKILEKQARERKARFSAKSAKSKETGRSIPSKTSTNNSLSSVNKDWEHWVTLQGGVEEATEDVFEIGSLIGVKYKGEIQNNFNLLSKEGRRDLRAAVERILSKGELGGSGVGREVVLVWV